MNCDEQIRDQNGDEVKSKTQLKYLGALLSSDGSNSSELGRRLGMAKTWVTFPSQEHGKFASHRRY